MFFLKEKRRECINGRFFTGRKINQINNRSAVLFDCCDSVIPDSESGMTNTVAEL